MTRRADKRTAEAEARWLASRKDDTVTEAEALTEVDSLEARVRDGQRALSKVRRLCREYELPLPAWAARSGQEDSAPSGKRKRGAPPKPASDFIRWNLVCHLKEETPGLTDTAAYGIAAGILGDAVPTIKRGYLKVRRDQRKVMGNRFE